VARLIAALIFAVAAAAQSPVRTCESLASVTLPGTTIESAAVEPASGAHPAFCRVTAVGTHPPAGDKVRIFVGLPLANWNGRFQGVGGGGFMGGSPMGVLSPVEQGYASASTDTGHEGNPVSGSFALDAAGHLNWLLIRDFAYLGIHEMTVTAKALVEAFYGRPPLHSYFNGCSTGGRQGLMEAQRYSADYDGILSGAPAINWTKLHVEQMWGPLVMHNANDYPPRCKFAAATAAAVTACADPDGIIADPRRCAYDPAALVGTTPAGCDAFTAADADVIGKIWRGPRRRDGSFLWYGLPRGADFMAMSGTAGAPLTAHPNPITLSWWRDFLTQNPNWDWTVLTPALYEQYFDQSVEEFSAVIATDNPDLAAFRDHGGRIVLWHGLADPLIYPEGTIDYYERVEKQMGGAENTAKFARLFLAPGVGHCGGGPAPQQQDAFDAVVRWVEEGKAPEILNTVRGGSLCAYPCAKK
jgi:feruloyl esterase